MNVVHLILLVFAAVCFLLATFEISVPRVNLVALGLAAWVLSTVLR